MLIDVFPALRLPRRFGAFTYRVPEGMPVAIGSLVRVVFRGRPVHALVAEVHDRPTEGMKIAEITEVIPGWEFAPSEIACMKAFALEAIQSVSSVFHAVLPALPKRLSPNRPYTPNRPYSPLSISRTDATAIQSSLPTIEASKSLFIECPDLRRTAAIIATARKRLSGPWTVCAPNVRDARLLASALSSAEPVVITGEESALAKERAWRAFRTRPDGLLIGTSIVSLLTHPAGGVLAVARSSHENHRREDRNPRFDARRNAVIRSKLQGGTVLYFDAFPRIDELEHAERISPFPLYPTTLADMRANRGHRAHPLISPEADEAITAAIEANQRVLIAFNRTSRASEPVRNLPAGIRPRKAWTIDSLAKELGTSFSCSAASAEKGVEILPDATIVVTTSHYLENLFNPFSPDGFGAVIEIGADQPLRDANPRALERALTTTAQWRAVANANHATFVIQTDTPDLFRMGLSDPPLGLKEEAEARKAYGYPPFGRAARIEQLPTANDLVDHLPNGVRSEPSEGGHLLMYPNDLMETLHLFLAPLPDTIRIDTTQFS